MHNLPLKMSRLDYAAAYSYVASQRYVEALIFMTTSEGQVN